MDKLQWGNRKWLRRVKTKDSYLNGKSDRGGVVVEKKTNSIVVGGNNSNNNHSSKDGHDLPPIPSPNRSSANDNRKSSTLSLPEKEDRSYTKRGSGGLNESSKVPAKEENRKIVWPRLLVSLSSKEKEEDFMLMKGCKLPQRPKKRAKLIQKTILLVSPGAWLSDVCRERYEVREKKTSKKKPRGLKAMGNMEIDSE